jgi:hypothetical protein
VMTSRDRAVTDNPSTFEKWCARVTLGVMNTIYGAALARAKVFERDTGVFVFVLYPAQAPTGLTHSATETRFMKMSLDEAVIHLYTARNPNKHPTLHLFAPTVGFREGAPASAPASQSPQDLLRELAKQRMTSTLLCRILPTGDGGFVLHKPKEPNTRVKLDDVVLRLFEAVVARAERFR